jgi:hypothetical protein
MRKRHLTPRRNSLDSFIDSLTPRDILEPDPRHPHVEGGVLHSCTNCQRIFVPTRFWHHFCCADCRQRYNGRKKPNINDLA